MDLIKFTGLIGTIAVPVIAAIAVFPTKSSGTALPVVRLALIVSSVWAGLALLRTVAVTIFWFTPSTYPYFTLRSQPFWPAPEVAWNGEGTEPVHLVTGGFTTGSVSAGGLSNASRMLLASSDAIGGLVTVALAAAVAWMCFRLVKGQPFASELARAATIAAVVCLIGGFAAQILGQIGGSSATRELINAGAAPSGLVADSGLALDFGPLWTAIGLGAFAALLRYGHTLQRDTEGLV